MTGNPHLRAALWLGLTAVAGVGGWAGGRAAREGLYPDSRSAPHSPLPPPAIAGPREPRVEPGTPAGKWMARVKTAAPGDFAALLDELDTLLPKEDHYADREAAQKWLLALWISKDVDAAVTCVAGKQDKFLGSMLGFMLGSVAPDKVAGILAGPHKNDLGEFFPSAALHSLATADPREFLKLSLDKNAAGSPWIHNWPRALATLAESDPAAAAAAWTAAGTKEPSRNSALFSILRTWTERDVTGARQWAESLTNETDRHLARHAWLGTLARRDPRAALKELAGMDAGEFLPEQPGTHNGRAGSLSDARMEIVAVLARENLQEALAAMQEMEIPPQKSNADNPFASISDPHDAIRDALVNAAAPGLPNDPALLLAELKKLDSRTAGSTGAAPDPTISFLLFKAKIQGWNADTALTALVLLVNDPVALAAADPVVTELTGTGRSDMLSALLKQAALQDAGKAVAALATLPGDVRGTAAAELMSIVRDGNPALLQGIAPLVHPDRWSGGLGQSLAQTPAENSAIVAALPNSLQAALAREGFARQWAKDDPAAATEWVTSLPSDGSPGDAASGLAGAWAEYDDTAASAWVASLPPGPTRDGAALGLASTVAGTDPGAAWQWASTITDVKLAPHAFWHVARQWGNSAPPDFQTAYAAAIERSGFTAETKADMLSELEHPPTSPEPLPTP